MPAAIVEQIILFGSQARGDNTEESDVDICIIVKEPLNQNEMKAYRYRLNKIFASRYRMPSDVIIISSRDFDRFKGVAGAIEYSIATEGVIV